MKKIAVTYGDINGIGFEVMVKALNKLNLPAEDVLLVGSKKVFDFYAAKYNLKLVNKYKIAEVPISDRAFEVGHENILSGEHCFKCLEKVCELVKTGEAKNIVTATVSKHALYSAGYNFSGQTEILEHFLGDTETSGKKSEMLFVAGRFRLMLLTRHLPLSAVPQVLTKELIFEKIQRLDKSLREDFGLNEPRIGVLALNPHAGEQGLLGSEEQKIIIPALNELREKGVNVSTPLVADAAFAEIGRLRSAKKHLPYDCYVAMYHDQGLIPVKLLAFDSAVNTTIGLGAIRTSPSHGTAYDIAGKNIARYDSMAAAIQLAVKLA